MHQICKRQCLFIPTEQDVAAKFFRTISSHGKRPDPAERASMHSTRVRSAVMTPSRKQREEKNAQSYFQHLARLLISCEHIQLDTVNHATAYILLDIAMYCFSPPSSHPA